MKDLLLRTRLGKPLQDIQALKIKYAIQNVSDSKKINTTYTLSPYKTGTTFLAGCYPQEVARHEPIRYFTVKYFTSGFDDIFFKRMNYLNLKLECSGNFSGHIDEIISNPKFDELNFLYLYRSPSYWINSVLNYWIILKRLKFDYIDHYFWQKQLGQSIYNFYTGNEKVKEEIIKRLAKFYFDCLQKSKKVKNIYHLNLEEINDQLHIIDELVGCKSKINIHKKRMNKSKFFKYENSDLDKEFDSILSGIKSDI